VSAGLWAVWQLRSTYKIVKAEPSDDTYVTDYAEAAVEELKAEGVDVNRAGWQAPTVEVTAGGE
jgi:hypothetical protein